MKKSAWGKKIKGYNIKPYKLNTSPKNRKRRERTGEGAAETMGRRREERAAETNRRRSTRGRAKTRRTKKSEL